MASEPVDDGEAEMGGGKLEVGEVVVVGDGTGAGWGRAGRVVWRRGWTQVVVRVV